MARPFTQTAAHTTRNPAPAAHQAGDEGGDAAVVGVAAVAAVVGQFDDAGGAQAGEVFGGEVAAFAQGFEPLVTKLRLVTQQGGQLHCPRRGVCGAVSARSPFSRARTNSQRE